MVVVVSCKIMKKSKKFFKRDQNSLDQKKDAQTRGFSSASEKSFAGSQEEGEASSASQSTGVASSYEVSNYQRVKAFYQQYSDQVKTALNWFYLVLLGPVICTIVAETLSLSGVFQLDPGFFFGNYMVYLILHMVLYILIRNIRVSCVISIVFVTIISIVNHFVLEFTGIPITLANILSAGTGLEVAGAYTYEIDSSVVTGAIIALVYLVTVFFIPKPPIRVNFHDHRKIYALVVAITVVGTIAYAWCPLWKEIPAHTWRPAYHYTHHGFAMCLIKDITHGVSLEAEGYDAASLWSTDDQTGLTTVNVGKGYTYDATDTETYSEVSKKSPNVIVVMNESFSDLTSYLDGYETSADPMPYVRSLMQRDDVVSGNCAVSVGPGTGTANSEFEFLTGNSMEFFNGNTPYVQFITSETPSLASMLGNRGYDTLAMHAYLKAGYNRTLVYDYFGFDKYLGIEDFDVDVEIPREDYPTDATNYAQLIEEFERQGKTSKAPQFIFNITMQNHGGYYETDYDWPKTITQTGPHKRPWDNSVITYESSMYMADQSVKDLIEYFEQVDEPTIILFFGDHEPRLSDEFYESGNWIAEAGEEETEGNAVAGNVPGDQGADGGVTHQDLEMTADLHKTPYFIWNNYGLDVSDYVNDKNNELVSLNYLSTLLFDVAGLQKSEYQTYLSDLRQAYPVVSSYYYTDPAGTMTSVDADNMPDALKQYQWLQYNNVFDVDNRIEGFYN